MSHDDEPVFRKSPWGTSRYTYNPRNPVGLGLIIAGSAFAIVMMVMMQNRTGPFAPPSEKPWNPPTSTYEPPAYTYEPPTDAPAPRP
ncbi:hypothetical protein [Streptomyces sp. CC208A]|uniref:hypothetical protein n=1 Tax=Streptomyces sp. CC208A TaxID=3044573 RepID=UPI0024A9AEF3|nr:hypothetical protein [Streptomyces sp. CC208A]